MLLMSKNYAAVSQQIVDAIGGVNNIGAVTHCMTRLRFVLNDMTVVDLAKLKAITGVLGVVHSEN
ncbi:PTS cellobiose/arbutin/salicin transporter subunit IIBC, partial [Salmonella enterica subsp. enterica serovar Enteritidis]|nr:PTS cellobiose/arbutin/salicin transporter subunit IIBC [Salmonella enterica subsp. enterica serovar Enteritidis]